MNRFDRILGILLFLRSKQSISAPQMAQHFEVSPRTIYRDLEALSELGVPVYAERGREGGFRLMEGYFLPPLMFSRGEAISLLLGLTLLRGLQARPFPDEMETAEQKLLAAIPERFRSILMQAEKLIGFEKLPYDIFHPERAYKELERPAQEGNIHESQVVTVFLQAVLDHNMMWMQYRTPYRLRVHEFTFTPRALLWDRDHWYLAGKREGRSASLWRADRVLKIKPYGPASAVQEEFDVRTLLEHNWLRAAMARWQQHAPVKIRLTVAQAERLQRDWYYRHACFEHFSEREMLMTFGEDNRDIVLDLLRWLGPGAELLEPQSWRVALKEELRQMLACYS
ncbi:WYL domain-containing protein [Ktedonosporobacter rubrisoli]|uniref:WYL domain-containing protein n=1 Tax=Ktedonosporobacter rubrisoli TaxID=2509675 RepID=A0A4P6JPW0_KTERU|nr:WYL domain-containing protein [Ktedonosporobacter rubrisoli]QBD76806.1 WYL domain-containing protein [Ktedonosporobacter rubrisoli]